MATEGVGPVEQEEQTADVELVRDILFGSQTRQYDQRFEKLAARLDRLDGQLEELDKALKAQAKTHKSHIKDLQEVTRKRSADTEATLGEMQEEISSALGTLSEGKASRDSLGDLLLEMGLRLKGDDPRTASNEKPIAGGSH